MKRTHGDSTTRLYGLWCTMKSRCYNPNMTSYEYYGGRGITICDEWRTSYAAFKEWALENGYKQGLTIDRIDVNGNYCPENCRWATRKEQNRNTRKNRIFTIGGKTQCMADWEEDAGISHQIIDRRMKKGLTFEEAIKKPVGVSYPLHNITFNGETHNLAEWSRLLGIGEGAIRGRLKSKHYTLEEALTELPNSRLKHDLNISYNGVTKHLKEWAEELNIPYSTLRKRIFELGFSVERAFTQPVKKMKRKF